MKSRLKTTANRPAGRSFNQQQSSTLQAASGPQAELPEPAHQAAETPSERRRKRTKFFLILMVIVAVPAFLTAINNDAGAYLCAYVSTALLMFSILDFLRRSRQGLSFGMTGIVAAFGLVSALFMSMSQIVGPSLYLAFMVGQAITVAVVLWLARSVPELSAAKA